MSCPVYRKARWRRQIAWGRPTGRAPEVPPSGGGVLAGAVGTRHLRAVEPTMSGAYGEGPMWVMGVTFGVSIMRAASSRGASFASGSHLGAALVPGVLVSALAASRRGSADSRS